MEKLMKKNMLDHLDGLSKNKKKHITLVGVLSYNINIKSKGA